MALTYTDITASTLKFYEKNLYDNIFTAKPLTEKLLSSGQVKTFEGGEKIFIPIEYAQNGTVGWINKNGSIPLVDSKIVTAVEDQWRILAGLVLFNDMDNVINRGPAQIVDMMKVKIKNLQKTMTGSLDTALHTTQSGESINGLGDICSASTTLHGLAVADYSGWEAYISSSAVPLTVIAMATAYNTVSDGVDHVDLILPSQTLYEKYESLVAPQLRFSDSRTADAGFSENLKFKGAVMVLDKGTTATTMYFLTTSYLYLATIRDRQFYSFPAVQAANQINEAVKVVWYGNLMCSNRARQGALLLRTA
jgi:hypothetical protein